MNTRNLLFVVLLAFASPAFALTFTQSATSGGRTCSSAWIVTETEISLVSGTMPRLEGTLYAAISVRYRAAGSSDAWTQSSINQNSVVVGYSGSSWDHPASPGTITRNNALEYSIRTRVISDSNTVLDGQEVVYGPGQPAGADKKVRLQLTNPSPDYAMNYKIYQDGVLIATATVPKASSQAGEWTVPTNSVVTVFAEIVGITKDGPSWVEVPDAVTPLGEVKTPTAAPINPSTATPVPETVVSPPANIPGKSPPKEPDKSVWQPTNSTLPADILDKGTYRQGVDKITTEIGKTNTGLTDLKGIGNTTNSKLADLNTAAGVTNTKLGSIDTSLKVTYAFTPPSGLPETAENVPTGLPSNATGPLAAAGKLPSSAPTFTQPGSVSAFSVALSFPNMATVNFGFDLANYDTAINIFKAIVRVCMAVIFWIAVVNTIKSAFAN